MLKARLPQRSSAAAAAGSAHLKRLRIATYLCVTGGTSGTTFVPESDRLNRLLTASSKPDVILPVLRAMGPSAASGAVHMSVVLADTTNFNSPETTYDFDTVSKGLSATASKMMGSGQLAAKVREVGFLWDTDAVTVFSWAHYDDLDFRSEMVEARKWVERLLESDEGRLLLARSVLADICAKSTARGDEVVLSDVRVLFPDRDIPNLPEALKIWKGPLSTDDVARILAHPSVAEQIRKKTEECAGVRAVISQALELRDQFVLQHVVPEGRYTRLVGMGFMSALDPVMDHVVQRTVPADNRSDVAVVTLVVGDSGAKQKTVNSAFIAKIDGDGNLTNNILDLTFQKSSPRPGSDSSRGDSSGPDSRSSSPPSGTGSPDGSPPGVAPSPIAAAIAAPFPPFGVVSPAPVQPLSSVVTMSILPNAGKPPSFQVAGTDSGMVKGMLDSTAQSWFSRAFDGAVLASRPTA